MQYLFFNGEEKELLSYGFKYNGYAYELESLGEFATPRLTIHFEKEKGIILFNYCAPYDINPNDIFNFLKEKKNENLNYFFKDTQFGSVPKFRWHHKFGVISDEQWYIERKKFSLDNWFEYTEGLEGFKLNKEILQLKEILKFLEIKELQ